MATATEQHDAFEEAHARFMDANQHSYWLQNTLKAYDEMCQKGLTEWPRWFKKKKKNNPPQNGRK